jgi:hypothetical protein
MNFIGCARELLLDYKKDWDTKKLKDPFEQKQFYELLDEVVLEARRLRIAMLALFTKKI